MDALTLVALLAWIWWIGVYLVAIVLVALAFGAFVRVGRGEEERFPDDEEPKT